MTDKQLEQAKCDLREEMKSHGYGYINGKYIKPPKRYLIRGAELSCIDMINSILSYGGFGATAEEIMRRQEQSYHNYLAQYVDLLGRRRVIELIQGQIDSIIAIRSSVFTDDEGITYNSIVWKHE